MTQASLRWDAVASGASACRAGRTMITTNSRKNAIRKASLLAKFCGLYFSAPQAVATMKVPKKPTRFSERQVLCQATAAMPRSSTR